MKKLSLLDFLVLFNAKVLEREGCDFMIVGSLALNLAGFDVEPHDIDLEVKCNSDKAEKIFEVLATSQNRNFHAVKTDYKNGTAEGRMDKVTWDHKPYVFQWKGVEINVWAVKEFSHESFLLEPVHHYKIAAPVSVLKKKMAYQRPKDYQFLNTFAEQILSIGKQTVMANGNWRDNCRHCPYYEECKSEKSAAECASFLNEKSLENIIRLRRKMKEKWPNKIK